MAAIIILRYHNYALSTRFNARLASACQHASCQPIPLADGILPAIRRLPWQTQSLMLPATLSHLSILGDARSPDFRIFIPSLNADKLSYFRDLPFKIFASIIDAQIFFSDYFFLLWYRLLLSHYDRQLTDITRRALYNYIDSDAHIRRRDIYRFLIFAYYLYYSIRLSLISLRAASMLLISADI